MQGTVLVEQFCAAPPGKLYCLHGGSGVFRLSLLAAGHALLNGVPVTLVDGSNRFDLYGLAEFARRAAGSNGVPEQVLQNIFISRAFTCYQMEAVLTERLPAFVHEKHSPVVLIFGLLDTFYDEQAPLFEVRNALERILNALHALRDEGIALLLASTDIRPASSSRTALFPRLASSMDRVYRLAEEADGRWSLEKDNGESRIHNPQWRTEKGHGTNSTDIYDGSPAGIGKLVQVPAGAAQRRSGCAG
jgi:hypothetical protein